MRSFIALLLVLFSFCALSASAQQNQAAQKPARTAQIADMTEGEVRKVDKESGKITLRHGEIKNLEMPAMTMAFQVKDPVMLDRVQAGDKVRFRAEKIGTAYTVTAIEAAK